MRNFTSSNRVIDDYQRMSKVLLVLLYNAVVVIVCSDKSVSGQLLNGNPLNTNLLNNLIFFSPKDEVHGKSSMNYKDAQLWKIHTPNLKDQLVRILTKLAQKWADALAYCINRKQEGDYFYLMLKGGEIWNVNVDGVDMFLNSHITEVAKNLINKTDLTYNVMIEDIQEVIDQNSPKETLLDIVGFNNLRTELKMSWEQFHNFSDINEFLYTMLEYFPKITHLITAGRSVEKRQIKALRISDGNENNPAILICGGMQGRDWISPASVTYMIFKLARFWNEHPKYMRRIDWYFIPVLNPDGYEYSRTDDRLWNKNRRSNGDCEGVNIERNFGFSWSKKGSSGYPCSNLYRGPEKFSEPETRALRKVARSIGPKLAAYIAVGGYGQVVTYPWGDGNYFPENAEEMHRVAKLAVKSMRKVSRYEYRIGSSFQLQLPSAGNSADWVLNRIKPEYVYNLALRDLGRYGFLLPASQIKLCGEESFEMIQDIAEAIS